MREMLGIAMVLVVVGCQTAPQDPAEARMAAMQNIKQVALGCYLYAADNNDRLPTDMAQLKPYVPDAYDPDAYTLALSGRLDAVTNQGTTILIRQNRPLPGNQQVVAYADGHAAIITLP